MANFKRLMVQNEDLDYFGLCSSLNATPELMRFKLYSLTKRGQAYHMPMEIQSNFLANKVNKDPVLYIIV